ncbi:hypothetical protein Pcaca05_05540 [Pectobacterium carotovorum subsp. carotovorum]|nr:hypothetical protein Pcaca05_05540 [Pectobacterium carotovorum subsp. carotovorum]
MKCPHCGEDLVVGSIPSTHMQRYGQRVLVATVCCGKAVVCQPYLAFRAEAYIGKITEDDWGTPFKTE